MRKWELAAGDGSLQEEMGVSERKWNVVGGNGS